MPIFFQCSSNNPCGDKCVAEFWNGDEQTACIDPADGKGQRRVQYIPWITHKTGDLLCIVVFNQKYSW